MTFRQARCQPARSERDRGHCQRRLRGDGYSHQGVVDLNRPGSRHREAVHAVPFTGDAEGPLAGLDQRALVAHQKGLGPIIKVLSMLPLRWIDRQQQ